MLAEPAETPVITPAFDTVTTALDDDAQVLLDVTTCVELSEKRAVATSGVVLPTWTDAVPVTVTEDNVGGGGGVAVTCTANGALAIPWNVAVMFVEPAATPDTTPVPDTVATFPAEEFHVELGVTVCVELSEKRAVATSEMVEPTPTVDAPLTVTELNVAAGGVGADTTTANSALGIP